MFRNFDLPGQDIDLPYLRHAHRPTLFEAYRSPLFGLAIVNAEMDHTAREIVDMSAAGECATIDFINAHCVNVLRRDADYREALSHADFLLPDGSGMAIAARFAGVRMGANLNGTDLFPELCRHAAAERQSIFLLGGKPGIAAKAAEEMRARFPDLLVAGTRDGYFKLDEEAELVAEINESGAAIVLVGMGVPLQEKFIARVRQSMTARIVLGVGGLFDYYSGTIPRAPMALRRIGCEWVWRLMQEPSRLFSRYVLGNPIFLLHAAIHAWSARRINDLISLRIKRFMDLILAVVGLAAAIPLILLIALAIKVEDGGPVFFRQVRVGRHGRPFMIWKFRSMVIDAERRLAEIASKSERDEVCFKMKSDPRITKVGSVLRRLSLDELPQLFNILSGDMSVVGPRPALPREATAYSHGARDRLAGTPGLTCTWQVSGRADIPFEEQVELDVEYLKSRSLLRDIWLIIRTIPAVITARGAY